MILFLLHCESTFRGLMTHPIDGTLQPDEYMAAMHVSF